MDLQRNKQIYVISIAAGIVCEVHNYFFQKSHRNEYWIGMMNCMERIVSPKRLKSQEITNGHSFYGHVVQRKI